MMPKDSIRGKIREFLEAHQSKLGMNILEIGSRLHDPKAIWLINRDLCPEEGEWLGIDIQPGQGVDEVVDAEDLPYYWGSSFSGVLCSEVLEHVKHPHLVIQNIYDVLKPGGYTLITTLLTHPIHGYPNDYWRFTSEGIKVLLMDAGFKESDIHLEYGIKTTIDYKVMDEKVITRECPIQIFAWARKSDGNK